MSVFNPMGSINPGDLDQYRYDPTSGLWFPITPEDEEYWRSPYDYARGPQSASTVTPTEPSGAENPSQQQAEIEFKDQEFVVEGQIDMNLCNPHLVGGKLLNLGNLGTNFSGKYHVKMVKNVISKNDGYIQTIDVKRNALGMRIMNQSSEYTDTVNREPAPVIGGI